MFEREEDGGFSVYVPDLPGCVSQGDSHEEAVEHVREAIECYLEALVKLGQPIPVPRTSRSPEQDSTRSTPKAATSPWPTART